MGGGRLHRGIPEDTKGRTIIVTGANTGLGFASAKILANAGARVVMGCRSEIKCATAAAYIRGNASSSAVFVDPLTALDLASLASVRAFAKAFQVKYARLDAILLNAGVMSPPYTLSEDGIEMQFAVNHLGHFYLTQLLLPMVVETAKDAKSVHIASVSSMMSFVSSVQPTRFLTSSDPLFMTLSALNDPKDYATPLCAVKVMNVLFVGSSITVKHRGL